MLFVHHAAAQHYAVRRVEQHRVGAHLAQVVGLQLPGEVIVGQSGSLYLPAGLYRRAAGQALQAALVAVAAALGHGIVGMHAHHDVAQLRMHGPVQYVAVHDHAAAYARAHRDVQAAAQPLARAHGVLGYGGRVHVGVKAHRYAQRLLERAVQGIVDPQLLGGRGYIAIGGALPVQIDRAEAAHAQRVHLMAREKVDYRRHGLRRRGGGNAFPLKHIAVFIAGGQHHLGAAGLQCAQ